MVFQRLSPKHSFTAVTPCKIIASLSRQLFHESSGGFNLVDTLNILWGKYKQSKVYVSGGKKTQEQLSFIIVDELFEACHSNEATRKRTVKTVNI